MARSKVGCLMSLKHRRAHGCLRWRRDAFEGRHVAAPVSRGRVAGVILYAMHPITSDITATTDPDAERFEQLFREQQERVFAVCLRLSGDRVKASELMQDVFVRIWERLHTLRDPADAGAWVRRVALNTVLNIKRGERRRLERVSLAGDMAHAPPEAAAHGVLPFATPAPIRRMALDDAIAGLSGRSRQVFVLHDVEGFATEDIASMLGTAPSTVRVHLARARAQLREALAS